MVEGLGVGPREQNTASQAGDACSVMVKEDTLSTKGIAVL